MIELYLSSDGKHTVHLSADSPEQLDQLSDYAMGLYETVLEKYGSKAQMWRGATGTKTNGEETPKVEEKPKVGIRIDSVEQAVSATVPHCPVHNVPMAYRQGKHGSFWSCPTKEPNGEWCKYTQRTS